MPLEPRPKGPKHTAITVRISKEAKQALAALCTMYNQPQGEVVQVLLFDALEEAQKKGLKKR